MAANHLHSNMFHHQPSNLLSTFLPPLFCFDTAYAFQTPLPHPTRQLFADPYKPCKARHSGPAIRDATGDLESYTIFETLVMARIKLKPRRHIAKPGQKPIIRITAVLNPVICPPTQVFTSTNGTRGAVLRLGGNNPDSKHHTHVVLLPGNPGVIEYYRPTLRSLWRRLPEDVKDSVTLHGIGYPGHDLRQLNGLRMFGVAQHVAFLEDYIADLKPSLQDSQLVLMGHSYGSYVAVRVAEKLLDDVSRVSLVMLMPALWQMGACAGWLSRLLLQDRFGTTSWLTWGLTALLPPLLRDTLITAQGYRKELDDITRTMVDGRQRGLFLNICALGRDEVINILEPGDIEVVGRLGDRSLLVYADVDKWCPPEGRRRVQKAFGEDLVTERAGDGVTHGFCLFEDETEKVVKVVAPWLCERIRTRSRDSMK